MAADISPDIAPIKDNIIDRLGNLSLAWINWFQRIYKTLYFITSSVSSDRGNASITIQTGKDARTQRFNTAITADRTVTLSAVNSWNGARFRIVRQASATGAFNIDVGGLKNLTAASQWIDVEYTGSAWIETGYGAL